MKAGANILDEGIVQAIENAVDKVMVNTVDSRCLELVLLEFPVESNFYRSPELRCV